MDYKSTKLTNRIADILQHSSCWDDFRRHLSVLPTTKEKGDAFEALVELYLTLDPKHATKIKHVWHYAKVPPKIRKHLNLPHLDEGIDLIAETDDGEYWAIQCKYREDESHSLTRRELSTFTDLAFGICKNISLALVCTTTERLTHKLKMYGDRISFCAADVWHNLDEDFFKRVHAHLKGRDVLPKPLNPRPHQVRAVKKAHQYFIKDREKRGKLIMPCGTGKSLTAYWIAEKLAAKSILIAVPSLALIRQTLSVWARESLARKKKIHWICVCSDETVSSFERDDVAVLTQDLGVKVHTDPAEIAAWLKVKRTGTTVVLTTYQSGKAISTALKKVKRTFDLGIMDEAHKTVGRDGNLFSHLLDDKNIAIRKRVFMTATERRYRGDSDDILSMDNPEVYGDTFELLSFKEALDCTPPILSDYKIVTIAVSRDEVAELIRNNVYVRPDKGKWDDDVEAEMLASGIALRKAIKKYGIKHSVSFHSSISRATAFKDMQVRLGKAFPSYGNLETFHVSGNTPTAVRSRIIDEFESARRSLITNARCLTEGVDVPNIDCVLFADPRRSTIDIVQAVGRALRVYKGKKFGYVIVPILVDGKKSTDAMWDEGAFKEVMTTLRALSANDDRIIEYFRSVSAGKKPLGKNCPVEFEIPMGVVIDANQFVRTLELKCWGRLAKLSWRPFEDARAFARNLKLKSGTEWRHFCQGNMLSERRLPSDIPTTPGNIYSRKGWKSMGDWLGTGRIADRLKEYRSFREARAFVRQLKLKSRAEWSAFCRGKMPSKGSLPHDIPARPDNTYSYNGWKNWGDWLGTGIIAPRFREYRSFREARDYVHKLKLKNHKEWQNFCQGKMPAKGSLPSDIPAAPQGTYTDKGWNGYGDWLGTGKIAPRLREYRSFRDARNFARKLQLNNVKEWSAFCRGKMPSKGSLPPEIPMTPSRTYADKGWKGYGDWLGTGTIANFRKEYRSFRDARNFVRKLKLRSQAEWVAFSRGRTPLKGKLPFDIPACPNRTYADKGWIGMGDWLGTGTIATHLREYLSFREARDFVRKLRLKNITEWVAFCHGEMPSKGGLPHNISATPSRTYADKGWKGVGDWLGTGTIASYLRKYRSFPEARAFARKLKLKSSAEWREFCHNKMPSKGRLPKDIPVSPDRKYADNGWKNWGDWLGTGIIAPRFREYRSFREARDYVHKLKLNTRAEWSAFCRGKMPSKGSLPKDIPANPNVTYADKGWKGVGDWLGTGTIASHLRDYRIFRDARAFARKLKLKNSTEWREFCHNKMPSKGRLPPDIPANPNETYADKGWKGVGDWLGTGTIASYLRKYRSFPEARAFARKLKLKSSTEWAAFCQGEKPLKGRLPPDIPSNPSKKYADEGWKGYGDWLGTGTIANFRKEYRSFRDARAFARKLKLNNVKEWSAFCQGRTPAKGRLPSDIPAYPDSTYAEKGWIGYGDWLGTGTIASHLRKYRSFRDARNFARKLTLKSSTEWQSFCQGEMPSKGKRPPDIPSNPDKTYANMGWKGMGDWLGTGKNRVSNNLNKYS